ncbi:MAG: DUF6155 family protein [Spirochaetia bacterium]|nr:DUF6155 family protein [Spirochaetia bacterium]MCF7953056.1 DUF6155 family protein [Spirochaetales bacterium]MCF8012637.1 DUF6155 family protein [Clostridiales bacterium]
MGVKELKKELVNLEKEELIGIITDLYKKAPMAKEVLDVSYNPSILKEKFEKYKKKITDEFFPEKGYGRLQYSEIRNAISKFSKISNDPHYIAELLLAHVQYGIDFTNAYGDIDEQFYGNIEKALQRLLVHLDKNNLLDAYKKKCLHFVDETEEIGWGFHEEISDLVYQYYDIEGYDIDE